MTAWRPDTTYIGLSLFSAAMTAGIGINLPYFPVWLAAQDLGDSGLAMIVAVPPLVRMLANPAIGAAADRRGVAKALALCATATCAGYWVLGHISGFWPLLACVIAISALQGPILSLADVLIFGFIQQRSGPNRALHYGSIRAWGSAAVFACMIFGGAMMRHISVDGIVTVLALAAAVTAIATWIMAALAPAGERPARAMPLPQNALPRRWLVASIILAASLIQASHAMAYTFSTLDWRVQGLSDDFIGIAWAAGVFTEVLLFLFAGSYVASARHGAMLFLGLGAAASCLRWGAMMLEPGAIVLLVLQMGHGLTFGATHLGAVSLLSQHVSLQQRAQAQTWLASAIAFLSFLATMASGPLHQWLGAGGYAAMVLLALAALACVAIAATLQERACKTLPERA